MDYLIFEAAAEAFSQMMQLERLGFLTLGVIIGLVVGPIPGLGGLIGLSLMLPFALVMDTYSAIAMMLGLLSVVATSDSVPAVLFGVPGTVGSAATVLDGFPMARRGEAARALGAAFSASVLGGLIGAITLGIAAPVLRPVLLGVGSPEMLAFCIFGLSLIAVLSGGTPLKGMTAACIGIMLATVGDDPQTATLRWTFGTVYLWEGIALVPAALGIFALPELADLAIKRSAIAKNGHVEVRRFAQLRGFRDTLRNWFLVLRCSSAGSVLGAVPGIGAAVIDWIAYGHAASTCKGSEKTFGKGDVRGVIASESSNNAKEGGALITTVAFGVPGSTSMALILGVLLAQRLVPGPDMLTTNLDVTYAMVWSVALANVIGGILCFLLASQIARIARIRIGLLAPIVFAVVFVGAYQGNGAPGDLWTLLIFGVIGFVMKRLRWPRPPLILGLVLGSLVERYMFISTQRYGADWLLNPLVIIILGIALLTFLRPALRDAWSRLRRRQAFRLVIQRQAFSWDTLFATLMLVGFVACFLYAAQWPFAARLVPQVISAAAVICLALLLIKNLMLGVGTPETSTGAETSASRAIHMDLETDFEDMPASVIVRSALVLLAILFAFFGLSFVIGMIPAMIVFMLAYVRIISAERWRVAIAASLATTAAVFLVFELALGVFWPQSLLGDLFPSIRSTPYGNFL